MNLFRKRKHVHIIYNKPVRDLPSHKKLINSLESRELGVSVGTHFDKKSRKAAARSDFVFCFLPTLPELRTYLAKIKEKYGVIIGVHPHEGFMNYARFDEYLKGSGLLTMGASSDPAETSYSFIDRFYFWGCVHVAEWMPALVKFYRLNPGAARVFGTIYHDYSPVTQAVGDRRPVGKILYCTGSTAIADYTDESFIKAGDLLPKDESKRQKKIDFLRALRSAAQVDRDNAFNGFLSFANRNPTLEFNVRLHPTELSLLERGESPDISEFIERLDKFPNIKLLPTERRIDSKIILEHDLVIHHGSTVGLEASLNGVENVFLGLERMSKLSSKFVEYRNVLALLPFDTVVAPDQLSHLDEKQLVQLLEQERTKQESKVRYAASFFRGSDEATDPPEHLIAGDIASSLT